MADKSVSEFIDEHRIFPRIFAGCFGWLLFESYYWFTGLESPTNPQSIYGAAILTAAAGMFKFYVESGKNRKNKEE